MHKTLLYKMGKLSWRWKVKVYGKINDHLNNAIVEDDEVVNDYNYFTSKESNISNR